MIADDIDRVWQRDELCSSSDSVFIGTGVCSGRTNGVEMMEGGTARVHSEIIDVSSMEHSFATTVI